MGVDILPRLKKFENFGIHYSIGGGFDIANLLMFAGLEGTAFEAVKCNYGYVRKPDALKLAKRLELLLATIKKEYVWVVTNHVAHLPKKKVKSIVKRIAADIGDFDTPDWLVNEMARILPSSEWDWPKELPQLIRLCRKGGGFWWC